MTGEAYQQRLLAERRRERRAAARTLPATATTCEVVGCRTLIVPRLVKSMRCGHHTRYPVGSEDRRGE
jgi:hypothetical protein